MPLARADVDRIAALARLELDNEEAQRLARQLSGMLDHFASLQALDLADVEPFSTAAEGGAPLRADEAGADALRLPPAALAPAWREGFFTVPRLAAQQAADPEAELT